ncbi:hypothetical protein HKD37_05G014258 [Glycine soja]
MLEYEDDKKAYGWSEDGAYMVKSIYHGLMERVLNLDHLKVEGQWVILWKLQIPHKVKHFL